MKSNDEILEVRQRIIESSASDHEESPRAMFLRIIRDPLRPVSKSGGLRMNPVLVLLIVLGVLVIAAFTFFCFGVV